GCITLVIPLLCAISTQSGKGKNASLAITAPFRSKLKDPALWIAWFRASTREVCPVPLAYNCLFLAKTIVLLLVCLHSLEANIRSSNSAWVGWVWVALLRIATLSVLS